MSSSPTACTTCLPPCSLLCRGPTASAGQTAAAATWVQVTVFLSSQYCSAHMLGFIRNEDIYFRLILWIFFLSVLQWKQCLVGQLNSRKQHVCFIQHVSVCAESEWAILGVRITHLIKQWHLSKGAATIEMWFFLHSRVALQRSSGLDETGPVVWHLALCLLLSSLFVAAALIRGIKSSGKVRSHLRPLISKGFQEKKNAFY